MPRDFSLTCKTFETPYPSVPTKSSEKKPCLPGRFRSQSGAFYNECIVCLGTSSHWECKQITCDAARGAAVPTSSAQVCSGDLPQVSSTVGHCLQLPEDGADARVLYVTLLHQQMRHLGDPWFSSSSIASTPSAMAVPKADIAGITLTLQTLGSYFGGQCSILLPFQWWLYCQHDVGQLDR